MAVERKLVLHIEVNGFNADDLDESVDIWLDDPQAKESAKEEARLYIVTEEWMREEVGLTLVSLPGEECLNDDFMVRAFNGRIVGAHLATSPKEAR